MKQHNIKTRFVRSEDVAYRRVVDEILIVPIRTNPREKQGIYTLNSTASLLWELLDGSRTVEELAAALAERFDVDLQRALADTESALEDLLSFGAVTRHGDLD